MTRALSDEFDVESTNSTEKKLKADERFVLSRSLFLPDSKYELLAIILEHMQIFQAFLEHQLLPSEKFFSGFGGGCLFLFTSREREGAFTSRCNPMKPCV